MVAMRMTNRDDDGYTVMYETDEDESFDRDATIEILQDNGFGHLDEGDDFAYLRLDEYSADPEYHDVGVAEAYIYDSGTEVFFHDTDEPEEWWVEEAIESMLAGEDVPFDIQAYLGEEDELRNADFESYVLDMRDDKWGVLEDGHPK